MLRRLILAFGLLLTLASAALAERRVALVMAAEDYRNLRPLDNPVNDARAVGDLLDSLGFEVFLETDRDLKRTRRALEDFRADAKGADVALVYFAGHGVAIGGVNYLLPVDADAASSARLRETSLPLAEVQAVLAEVAPVSIVLLDACRDDPFAGPGGGEGDRGAVALAGDPPDAPKTTPGLGRIGRSDGVLFAFSAAPGETASDGTGGNSPFAGALLRHFGTKGVELKSALTLVQQDVYDRSRGKQLPYIESGLPALVFLSEKGDLPERDRLLMAMADLTPDLRAEVENLAAQNDMPLAPLYAALISADLESQGTDERRRLLEEAARSYRAFQSELVKYASDDPRVAELRARAEEQLSLGAFDTARALLTEAAGVDADARSALKTNYLTRTLSEASTHLLNANAARTDLRYDLAIADLTRATELYAEVEADLPDRETRASYLTALGDLGDLYMISGNSFGALGAQMTRAEFAESQMRADPLDIGWTRELIWALNAVGSVLQEQGYLREAEEKFVSGLELIRRQSEARPDDLDLMRDVEVMRNKLGEVRYELADYPGALEAFTEGLSIAERLLETNPNLILYLEDVSYVQERIGDVHVQMGDNARARDAFDIALGISQRLLNEFPDDPRFQFSVSVGYERLGDMMYTEGDFDSALAIYTESLKLRETLLTNDPANRMHQRDSAVTYSKLGDTQEQMGDVGSALMSHLQALSIRESLVALDPGNTTWASDVANSYLRIGDLHLSEGDLPGALEAYEKGADVRRAVVAVDPSNLPRQSALSSALERIGDVQAQSGDDQAALATHSEVLEMRRTLVDADPTLSFYRRSLMLSLQAVARILDRMNDAEGALAHFTQAIGLAEGLAAETPEDLLTLRDWNIAQNETVELLLRLNRPAEAAPIAEAAMEVVNRMSPLTKPDATFQIDRFITALRLGDTRRANGDLPGAAAAFTLMVEASAALTTLDPYATGYASDYALSLERLGEVLAEGGDMAGAQAQFQVALDYRRWLAPQEADPFAGQRAVAYVLQKLAATRLHQNDPAGGRPLQEEALAILAQVRDGQPDNVWNAIDLADSLERLSGFDADPAPRLAEALAVLEGLQAQGQLPDGYAEEIARYRTALGR